MESNKSALKLEHHSSPLLVPFCILHTRCNIVVKYNEAWDPRPNKARNSCPCFWLFCCFRNGGRIQCSLILFSINGTHESSLDRTSIGLLIINIDNSQHNKHGDHNDSQQPLAILHLWCHLGHSWSITTQLTHLFAAPPRPSSNRWHHHIQSRAYIGTS